MIIDGSDGDAIMAADRGHDEPTTDGNPHEPGSPLHEAWQLGYDEGLDAVGMTYDDDPESARSVAYDVGRTARERSEGIEHAGRMQAEMLGTTDAMVWATRFVETFGGETVNVEGSQYDGGIDFGTLLGWFANAIEVGRSAGARPKGATDPEEPEPPYEPILTSPEPEDLAQAIGVAVGAASVCWTNPLVATVFRSERAVAIVDELKAWIEERYAPKSSTEG